MKFSEMYPDALPIMEMLDTKFDSINWLDSPIGTLGTGTVKGTNVQIKLTPITYDQYSGVNITFAVQSGNEYTEVFQDNDSRQAAYIIGAVTNAVKDKLAQFDWDFIVLIAKDNVEARSRLYTRIADRLQREQQLGYSTLEVRGVHLTVMSQLPREQVTDLLRKIA